MWKDGLRYLEDGGTVQRWLCRECGYRFSDPTQKRNDNSSYRSSQDGDLPGLPLKMGGALTSDCQVGALSRKRARNLVEVETRQEKAPREGTEQTADVKGKIVEYIWFLKKQGYASSTVKNRLKIIKRLHRDGVDLMNPEDIRFYLAQHDQWSNHYRRNIVCAYQQFVEMAGLEWTPPRYKPVEKLPFIPHEEEIDALISGTGTKVSVCLQLLKETGMRIGEAWKLQWTDVDIKNRTIKCTPEKHGHPRMFQVSEKLITMLQQLPKKNQWVFSGTNLSSHRSNFTHQRKRLARKLGNPRLDKITFHTLRHWKATMEYHKTKDILHVKQLLGHRRIKSTMRYTQLVHFPEKDEWTCRVAETVEEAKELVEAGFQYVTAIDHKKLFRKRK